MLFHYILFTTCTNRTNALKALLTIAICTTPASFSNRNRETNSRLEQNGKYWSLEGDSHMKGAWMLVGNFELNP